MGRGDADVELAPAGPGHRATGVGVGAGTDDRRVADPAVALIGHPAGRGAGGQVALAVQGQGTDGAEVPGDLRRSEEHTSELQSLMRISYAVFCLTTKN